MSDGASEAMSDARAHRGLALWQVVVLLGAFYVAQIGAGFILLVFQNGFDFAAIRASLGSVQNVQRLIVTGGLATVCAVLVLTVWFARARGLGLADFGLVRAPGRWFFYALLLLPFTYLVGILAQWYFGEDFMRRSLQTSMGFVSQDGWMTAATALVVIILMPFVEELFFRATMFGALRKYMRVLPAMLVATLLFVVIHAQYTLAGGMFALVASAQLALLSFLLMWLYVRSGSLWPSIMLHMLNNGIAFSAAYAYYHYPQAVTGA